MAVRKHKSTKHPTKKFIQIHPAVLLVFLAGGLLGLVFKFDLLSPDQASSGGSVSSSLSVEERQAAVMKELIGKTRHFKGEPNAPVTIIEFSDFQ